MVRVTVAHLGLDRMTNTPVVVLKEDGGDRTLQIWIGAPEANAIALELRGEKPARPMTHDLLKSMVQGLGGTLRRVTITGLKDNTYFAELLVFRGEHPFEIDARPSDSIALALRFDAPIFVAEDLFRTDDDGPSGSAAGPDQADPDALKRFLSKLDPEDLGRFQP
ncbi:MAG: bifunctional nuclease family protein [Gemmatimonadetes bacterium]|nr:bifunctional nuclease family protein [Gemmatimonadota bacterium]MCC7133421.1 bifunctional nuclease family protein [Gemmatimonadales bacterium]